MWQGCNVLVSDQHKHHDRSSLAVWDVDIWITRAGSRGTKHGYLNTWEYLVEGPNWAVRHHKCFVGNSSVELAAARARHWKSNIVQEHIKLILLGKTQTLGRDCSTRSGHEDIVIQKHDICFHHWHADVSFGKGILPMSLNSTEAKGLAFNADMSGN
jgi:hypothetical protein